MAITASNTTTLSHLAAFAKSKGGEVPKDSIRRWADKFFHPQQLSALARKGLIWADPAGVAVTAAGYRVLAKRSS